MSEENNVCRICLRPQGIISVFSISAASMPDTEASAKYSEQIMRCTRIQICENDGLPSNICSQCEAELAVSYRFVVKCEASDTYLRKIKSETVLEPAKVEVKEERIDYNFMNEEYLETDGALSDFGPLLEQAEKKKKKKKRKVHQIKNENVELDSDDEFLVKKRKRGRPRKDPMFLSQYISKYTRQKRPPMPCETCGLLVSCRSAMEIHIRVHSEAKPFSCTECSAAFKAKGTLKRHYEVHHTKRERKFTCEACGDRFYRKRDIVIHMRTHTGEKPYSCDICDKKYSQQGPLIRHKRIHTGERPYPCPLCSKSFIDKNMVTKHMVVHSEEKKYNCYLCGKAVKTKTALNSHVRLHANEKSYVCSFCGIPFSTRGNLKLHTDRVHSERSGQCGVCHKTFSDVAQHMNKHTGNLPFKCSECTRAFASKRSLSNHIKFRHVGVDKFKCTQSDCKATFPAPSMLQFHLLKHHMNQTPFVCEHCSRGFFRASDLSRHLRVSHLHLVKSENSLSVSKLVHNDQ